MRLSSFARAMLEGVHGGRAESGGGTGEEEGDGGEDGTRDSGLVSVDDERRMRRSLAAEGASMKPYLITGCINQRFKGR